MNENLIQKFGFCEMYEWSTDYNQKLGLFVTFDENSTDKIAPYGENPGAEIIGVSSINSVIESNNPSFWPNSYLCNEYGDLYLQKERLSVGQKVYDQVLEFNYIQTRPWEHYIPIANKALDPEKQYIPRTSRQEWVRVTLLGRAIVKDNGKCEPGKYCAPYSGKMKKDFGMAVPVEESTSSQKYYVLRRMSEHSIEILMK